MQITAFANIYWIYRYWLMPDPNSLLPVPAWTLLCLWVIAPVRAALNHLCNVTVIPVIKLVSDGLRGWVHSWSSYVYYWPQHSYPACNTHSGCYTADWWYECCIDTEVQKRIIEDLTRCNKSHMDSKMSGQSVGADHSTAFRNSRRKIQIDNKSIRKNIHPWIFTNPFIFTNSFIFIQIYLHIY